MSRPDVTLTAVAELGLRYNVLGGNMKKIRILLAIIILVVCSACNNNRGDSSTIKYETGVFHDKHWEEQTGTYQEDVIPDRETAIAIATQIFNGMKKSTTSQEYTPQHVFYDEEEAIWIVSFWKGSNTITLGDDCSIAMQKKDGKVLRIWFGE